MLIDSGTQRKKTYAGAPLRGIACLCAQVEGYMYSGSQNRMRMRIFNVLDDVKRDHGFAPIVTRPAGDL